MKNLKPKIIVFIFCTILIILSACGSSLSGTYKSDYDSADIYTFESGGKVTVTSLGIPIEGTYKINDDEITIDLGSLFGEETYSFKKNGISIYIDGYEYIKE